MLFGNSAPPSAHAAPDRQITSWPTVGVPATFAPPVHALEDEVGMTLVFDLSRVDPQKIAVEVVGQTIFIFDREATRDTAWFRPSFRSFTLPPWIEPASVQARVLEGMLTVHAARRAGRPLIAVTFVAGGDRSDAS